MRRWGIGMPARLGPRAETVDGIGTHAQVVRRKETFYPAAQLVEEEPVVGFAGSDQEAENHSSGKRMPEYCCGHFWGRTCVR